MDTEVNKFNDKYKKQNMIEPDTNNLFIMGCEIIQSNNSNNQTKLEILYKLIPLYPREYILYYWMGYLYKDTEPYIAYYWFNQCYKINPIYIHNLLDMIKWLFDRDNFERIQQINDDNNNILYTSTDIRIQLITASYEAKMKRFQNSEKLYKKILEEPKLDHTVRLRCYSNIGILYNDLGCNKNAVLHLETAISLYNDIQLNKDIIITFQNLFITYDYTYNDAGKVFSKYSIFDNMIIKRNEYDFSQHNQNKRIKIGYLSGDFINHAVSKFIHPIINNHTSLFEIHCFSISNLYYVNPLQNCIYHNIVELNIQELANYIYNTKIDILIDLAGHTHPNRIEVFGLNPAPIQMTYLGFPNTTGLSTIKYRITDNIADHPNSKQKYSEKLYKLPKCFLLYENKHEYNIDTHHKILTAESTIILGSINKENKTSIYTLKVWKTILSECPNVKLLILLKSDNIEEIATRTEYYSKMLNVLPERLIITPHQKSENEYMSLFSKIDILLDTFPYSGTTTTCNALISSIPVVTKYHTDYHSHNVSSSLLINTGVSELVAHSDDEYIQIVKTLIADPERIMEYKNTIRNNFLDLMNPPEFIKSYENMMLEIYELETK